MKILSIVYVFTFVIVVQCYGQRSAQPDVGLGENIARFDHFIEILAACDDSPCPQFDTYFDSLWTVCAEVPDSLYRVRALLYKSSYYTSSGRVRESLDILAYILPIAIRNGYLRHLRFIYMQLGLAYSFKGNYDLALRYMFESLKLRERDGDAYELAIVYSNIGLTYYKLRDNERALLYYNKTIRIHEDQGNVKMLPDIYVNMGLAYTHLENHDSAFYYYNLAGKRYGANINDYQKMHLLFAEGLTCVEVGQFEKAEQRLSESLRLAEKNGHDRFKADNLVRLARVHIARGDLPKGAAVLRDARLITESGELHEILLDVYRQYIQLAKLAGDVEMLREFQQLYIGLSDQLYDEQVINKISVYEIEFSERKNVVRIEDQARLLELQDIAIGKKRWIIALIGASIPLFVSIIYLLVTQARKKNGLNDILNDEVERRTKELYECNEQALIDVNRMKLELEERIRHSKTILLTLKGLCVISRIDDTTASDDLVGVITEKLNELTDALE